MLECAKPFKKSEYLYGKPGSYFKNMIYREAVIEKIRLGKALRNELSKEVFDNGKHELNTRLNDVIKAIVFNEMLLKELDEKI
jgi:hypothetical protein